MTLLQDSSSDWRAFARGAEGPTAAEPEPHSVWLGANCVYESTKLRLGYASLVTPKQVV